MRTFKCRGGLANDEPLQLELVATASDRRSSTQKELPLLSPRSRSGPVRYVCRQGYVQRHAPTYPVSVAVCIVCSSLLTSASTSFRLFRPYQLLNLFAVFANFENWK